MTQTKPTVTASLTGKWKSYPAYKDSGVEWLGEVPAHWDIFPLKRLAKIRYGLGQPPAQLEDGTPFVRATNVKSGIIVDEGMLYVDFKDIPPDRDAVLSPGEIIVVRSGAYTGDSAIVPKKFQGAIAGYDMVVTITKGYSPFFAWQLLSREVLGLQFNFFNLRAAQSHLNSEDLGNTLFLVPSLPEQRAIATHLDNETAKIDALIAKKERLVELLQEKRAALISHAVTKGLDPTVPMKDSGMEWIGEIPAHWGMGKIGAECTVKARLGWRGLKASEYVDEGYIFLATPNIKGREIDFENVNHITAERYFESPEIMLQVGDVLVAKDGSTLGITSVIRYLPAPATVNSSIAVIRPQESLNSVFLYWFLSSNYIQEFIQRMKDGMGVPHLFQADLRKFVVLIPSLPEQCAIAAFLDRETAKIDALISRIQEGIEKLKEYSTALISAAVTGKIDVREEIPSPGDRDL